MYNIFQYIEPITSTITYVELEECPSFPYTEKKKFENITSVSQDGYIFTRPRFTKDRSIIQLNWNYLVDSDKETLETFESDIRGVSSFYYFTEWPETPDTNYINVVLQNAITYELVMRTTVSKYWNVTINLEEV